MNIISYCDRDVSYVTITNTAGIYVNTAEMHVTITNTSLPTALNADQQRVDRIRYFAVPTSTPSARTLPGTMARVGTRHRTITKIKKSVEYTS